MPKVPTQLASEIVFIKILLRQKTKVQITTLTLNQIHLNIYFIYSAIVV